MHENQDSSVEEETKPIYFQIDIEVEEEVEYTSEEEPMVVQRGRSLLLGSSQTLNIADSLLKSVTKRKQSDHLQLFQQKMKTKLALSLKKKKASNPLALESPRLMASGLATPASAAKSEL